MWEEILELILPNILEIIISIISTVVAYLVIPCIKNDLIPALKERNLYNTVKKFVQAVEKLYESGVIPKEFKKKAVIKLLTENGIVVNNTVDVFIESAVKELDIITSTIYDEFGEVKTNEDEDESVKGFIETDDV